MSSNVANLSDTAANAAANAIAALCNSGTIVLYSGTQPANANTPIGGGNVALATLTFGATAFGAASGGVITANAITAGVAGNSGTTTFARIYETGGSTAVFDAQVNVSGQGAFIVLSTNAIVSGATVSCSAFTFTVTEL